MNGDKILLEYYTTHKAKDEAASDNPPINTDFIQAVLDTKAVIEKLHSEGKTSV